MAGPARLACYGCATAAHDLGDLPAALARYRESLRYWEGIGDLGERGDLPGGDRLDRLRPR